MSTGPSPSLPPRRLRPLPLPFSPPPPGSDTMSGWLKSSGASGGSLHLGVFQRPLTLILLQKYRDTNGRHIVIQIGGVTGVYTTLCQKEGIHLQKYRDRNGKCIAILFQSIGVRGRCGFPDSHEGASLKVKKGSFCCMKIQRTAKMK